MIKSIAAEYINILIYSPLSASSYNELPVKSRNSMKSLINIKNNDNKCFLWCYIRHLNPLKSHSERVTKANKNMVHDLDYEGIEFTVSGKDDSKIEQKIFISVFCYENNLVYPVYVSDKKFEDKHKSHYVNIKDFNRFMCNETKCRNKKHFCKYCLQCFSSERDLIEHKESCLKIKGKQSVK